MNRFLLRVGGATSALMMVGLLAVPASLAADCTISGNGARSHNTCTISNGGGSSCHRHRCGGGGGQSNSAVIFNGVTVHANTGGNEANKNTGGDVTVTSGNANVNVTITNTVNSNISGSGI